MGLGISSERLKQLEAEQLSWRFFGRSLPMSYAELKAAYKSTVMRLRPDLANNKANDDEFIAMKTFHTALLEQAPVWAFTDAKSKAKTVTGVSLDELGLGLGPLKNGRDCTDCDHKGYTEIVVSGWKNCMWCSLGWAYTQPCLRCNGTGNGPKQKPQSCPQCKGSGSHTFARAIRCKVCNGVGGKIIPNETVEYTMCYKCKGTGEIEVLNPVIPKGLLYR